MRQLEHLRNRITVEHQSPGMFIFRQLHLGVLAVLVIHCQQFLLRHFVLGALVNMLHLKR